MKFNISTRSIGDGRIEQTITTDAYDQHRQVYTMVMDTRERQTRQALIDLGWTPPITVQDAVLIPLPHSAHAVAYGNSWTFCGNFSVQDIIRVAMWLQRQNSKLTREQQTWHYEPDAAPRRVSLQDMNMNADVFYPEVYHRDTDGLVTHVITPVSKWPVWTSEVSIRSNV